jgi:hypothetical protein
MNEAASGLGGLSLRAPSVLTNATSINDAGHIVSSLTCDIRALARLECIPAHRAEEAETGGTPGLVCAA